MRIDRFLALRGLGTRSEVRNLLRAGRVQVDGMPARNAGLYVDAQSRVTLDGEPLSNQTTLHIMLNKPSGWLTAARDTHRRTVMDLLSPQAVSIGCMPVGRLDIDTEGLLLFTTDGQLAHRLLSPRRHVQKVYRATVDMALDDSDVRAFAAGIALSDFTALPAELTVLPGALSAYVTVEEGKYHQVKRMFGARGKTVCHLERLAFGGVSLDETLVPGAWRELTADELDRLLSAAGMRGGDADE